MSKQTMRQIGLLIVLVLIGAGVLWNVEFVQERIDTTNESIQEEAVVLDDEDPLIAAYREEGFPTATELSPNLREYMIALFTQTDAFTVVQRVQFGGADEWATIVSMASSASRDERLDERVCGVDGEPLCVLFYQYSDGSVEIYDIYQTFDPAFDSYYEYAPEIIDILSMPYSGDVLVGGFIPFAMGKDTMRYDIANASGRTNIINISTTDGQQFHVASSSTDLSLDARVDVIRSDDEGVESVRVTVSDDQQTLLTADSPSKPWALGVITTASGPLGFNPKSTYTQQSIYFTLFEKNYVYGRSLNADGQTIYTLEEVE